MGGMPSLYLEMTVKQLDIMNKTPLLLACSRSPPVMPSSAAIFFVGAGTPYHSRDARARPQRKVKVPWGATVAGGAESTRDRHGLPWPPSGLDKRPGLSGENG